VPNAEFDTWFGLFAPAKTPRAIVERLHAETMKAVETPEVKERLAKIGAEPTRMSLDEFDAQLKREFVENEKLVKTIGIKLE
jgi:tripartite-type tricarboxylate transporter receptor subunit TctC